MTAGRRSRRLHLRPGRRPGRLRAVGRLAAASLSAALLGGAVAGPGLGVAAATTPDACATGTNTGDMTIRLTVGGVARSAVLHLPSTLAGTHIPLIVAYHGFGGSGREFDDDTGLSSLGDRKGFAVVYPSSNGLGWGISGAPRDVVFTAALLDQVESTACIAESRVYAMGVSIGAGMAARVGCELSARIAGLVLVSGGYRSLPACNPDRPVSILEIHGTSDTTVPYGGRGTALAGAVLPYMVAWAARDRCTPAPTHTRIATHALLYRWTGCASGAVVEHLRINGGRHGLPNAVGHAISSGDTTPIAGANEVWHFLASRSISRPFPLPAA